MYQAHDERLERRVAIKKLHAADDDDQEVRARLRREARAVASLNHPAIVQIYDILETEEDDWIVMELVEGPSLEDLVRENRLPLAPAVFLVAEVANGLTEAHARGIVHRDLKAENVKVTQAGHAKILDFGLAKTLEATQEEGSAAPLSRPGMIVGTSRSMSPEQAKGEAIDHRSDIFSLGSLLYEVVTGKPAFDGNNVIHILTQICTESPPPATEVEPSVPQELSDFIEELMAKDPADRPQETASIGPRLTAIAAGLGEEHGGLTAGPSGLTRSFVPVPGASSPPPPGNMAHLSTTTYSMTALSSYGTEAKSGVFIKTLTAVTLASAEDLARHFDEAAAFERFNLQADLVRELLATHGGFEITAGESFRILFERPVDAIQFSQVLHQEISRVLEVPSDARDGAEKLQPRIAIHLGEVFFKEGNDRPEVERGAETVLFRASELASPRQVLITEGAFEMARQALTGNQSEGDFLWFAHGRYAFEGVEDTVSIFEVRPAGTEVSALPSTTSVARLIPNEPTTGRPRWPWFLAAAVVLAIVLAFGWRRGEPSSPELAEGPPSIAVCGLHSLLGQPEPWLETTIIEILAAHLGAEEEVRVIPGDTVAAYRRHLKLQVSGTINEADRRELRRRLGTDYLVTGSYLPNQSSLTLTLQLQNVVSGEAQSFWDTRDEDELFDLVAVLAGKMRHALGVSPLRPATAERIQAMRPNVTDAGRFYAEGLVRWRIHDAAQARQRFRQAIELDPDFALAHLALAEAQQRLGELEAAGASARQAMDLADGLPTFFSLRAASRYYQFSGQGSLAVEPLQTLVRVLPHNLEDGLLLVEALTPSDPVAAEAALKALRELPEPLGQDPRIDLAEAYLAEALLDPRRQLEASAQVFRQAVLPRLKAEARRFEARALMAQGENDKAQEAFEKARGLYSEAGDLEAMRTVGSELNAAEEIVQ